jgi:hypothetical protein
VVVVVVVDVDGRGRRRRFAVSLNDYARAAAWAGKWAFSASRVGCRDGLQRRELQPSERVSQGALDFVDPAILKSTDPRTKCDFRYGA